MRPRSLLPMGDLEKYPITFNPQPSIAGEPILPQVNRSNLRNHLCFSTLLQVSRYTCGRPSTGNVPQKALSLGYALQPPFAGEPEQSSQPSVLQYVPVNRAVHLRKSYCHRHAERGQAENGIPQRSLFGIFQTVWMWALE